jgi:hypothetical protein
MVGEVRIKGNPGRSLKTQPVNELTLERRVAEIVKVLRIGHFSDKMTSAHGFPLLDGLYIGPYTRPDERVVCVISFLKNIDIVWIML